MRAIPEHLSMTRRYTNPRLPLPLPIALGKTMQNNGYHHHHHHPRLFQAAVHRTIKNKKREENYRK